MCNRRSACSRVPRVAPASAAPAPAPTPTPFGHRLQAGFRRAWRGVRRLCPERIAPAGNTACMTHGPTLSSTRRGNAVQLPLMPALTVAAVLCACAGPQASPAPVLSPLSPLPTHKPRTQAAAPTARELTLQELLAFRTVRAPGPGDRLFGFDTVGSWRGHRFVAEYICSDVCPEYTVTVHHFIDLKTVAECTAIGAAMQDELVPRGIGVGRRWFCMPTRAMKKTD